MSFSRKHRLLLGLKAADMIGNCTIIGSRFGGWKRSVYQPSRRLTGTESGLRPPTSRYLPISKKRELAGKDLMKFSLDTVKMFYNDAQRAGYTL